MYEQNGVISISNKPTHIISSKETFEQIKETNDCLKSQLKFTQEMMRSFQKKLDESTKFIQQQNKEMFEKFVLQK